MLRSIMREIYGLFVDDGSLAAALLAWIVVAVTGLTLLHAGHWGGPVFFAGLTLVFGENVTRASRRMR